MSLIFAALMAMPAGHAQISSVATKVDYCDSIGGYTAIIVKPYANDWLISYCRNGMPNGSYVPSSYLTAHKPSTNTSGPVYTFRLPDSILINDMEQLKFSDSIYFCGSKCFSSNQRYGVVGFIIVDPTFTNISIHYYLDSSVYEFTKLTAFRLIPYLYIYTLGTRSYNSYANDIYKYIILGLSSNVTKYPSHDEIFWDVLQTDEYVAVVGTWASGNLSIRKEPKTTYSTAMQTHYFYNLGANGSISKTYSTFLGDLRTENRENNIAVAFASYGSLLNYNLKTIDINTMQMTNAQHIVMNEKNDLDAIDYVQDCNKVVMLSQYPPYGGGIGSASYLYYFNPYQSIPYIGTYVCPEDYYTSLCRVPLSTVGTRHFALCKPSLLYGLQWYYKDVYINPVSHCDLISSMNIEIDNIVQPSIGSFGSEQPYNIKLNNCFPHKVEKIFIKKCPLTR